MGRPEMKKLQKQINRQLIFLIKDALRVQKRMDKIANKLGIPENEDIKKIVNEIQQLIRWE